MSAATVQDASQRQQMAISQALVEESQAALGLLQRQLNAGYASRLDLAN